MSGVKLTTLANGLRIVTDHVADAETVAVGVWASVGTRHEDLRENGVAHMVEHMLFKGTPSMDAKRIAEIIEDVGGDMNAYTDREMTGYYIHALRDHLDLALNVLADILQNSTMPEDEVERERGVILQEIKMYADTPDRQIFDNFQEAAYPKQSLGTPGLGTPKIIAKMQRDTLMKYVTTHYSAKNLIVSAAGAVPHEDFVRKIEALFAGLPQGQESRYEPADYKPTSTLHEKKNEQANIVLGFRGLPRSDSRFTAFRLLSSILGGGMSSRLFQEIREKRGLVYSIYSFQDAFHDDGILGIYAGTGPEHLKEFMPVVLDEIKKIQEGVTASELNRAKAQIKSGVLMSRESILTRADQQARYLINYGRTFNVADLVKRIDAVTEADVKDVAQLIFKSQPTLAAIGPLKKLMTYEDIAKNLAA